MHVLYHTLSDEACAEVRRWLVQKEMVDQVQFRNIDRSEEALKDLIALQGSAQVPVMVIDSQKYFGKDAIIRALENLKSI